MPDAPRAVSPVACAWCGHALDSTAESLPGRLRCAVCGAATTSPWPSDEELDRAYGSWYRPATGRFAGPGDALLRRSRSTLARRLDRLAPPGPILDVGAGDGTLVDALRATGREAIGIERASARADLRTGEVTDVDGRWAAVVFWHSLEHMRRPNVALAHAAGLLAPHGVLAVAVPNAGSWQARLFGEHWLALDLPRHLVHLPAAGLIARLRELGLSIERVSHWRGGQVMFGWLHGLVGLLPGRPDLYDAIRRGEARRAAGGGVARAATIAAALILALPAAIASAAEVLARRGGTIYVEARRVQAP